MGPKRAAEKEKVKIKKIKKPPTKANTADANAATTRASQRAMSDAMRADPAPAPVPNKHGANKALTVHPDHIWKFFHQDKKPYQSSSMSPTYQGPEPLKT